MPEIDWSKPIELYDKKSGKAYADAKVVTSDLTGWYPFVVRWSIPENKSQERVDIFTTFGEPFNYDWHVRNKPVVRRKWVVLAITKSGGMLVSSRETEDAAHKLQEFYRSTDTFATCAVVELEWTEE